MSFIYVQSDKKDDCIIW